jgi:type IV secretion system protein VirD4
VQPLFFKDPVFKARAAIPAPMLSDKLIPMVSEEDKDEGIKL